MGISEEGIDKSQWLPKVYNRVSGLMERIPPVNPFRARQGAVVWQGEAIKALVWMPDILNAIRNNDGDPIYLTDDELHTCKRVERTALSAMAALGLSNIRTFMAGDMNPDKLPQNDPFKELLQGMPRPYSHALLWVICDDRNGGNLPLALKIITSIRTAVEHAKNILERLEKS